MCNETIQHTSYCRQQKLFSRDDTVFLNRLKRLRWKRDALLVASVVQLKPCILVCVVRWLHASCDGISSEDEAELAIDHNYHCVLCRPATGAPVPGKAMLRCSSLCVPLVCICIILS